MNTAIRLRDLDMGFFRTVPNVHFEEKVMTGYSSAALHFATKALR